MRGESHGKQRPIQCKIQPNWPPGWLQAHIKLIVVLGPFLLCLKALKPRNVGHKRAIKKRRHEERRTRRLVIGFHFHPMIQFSPGIDILFSKLYYIEAQQHPQGNKLDFLSCMNQFSKHKFCQVLTFAKYYIFF